MNRADLSFEGMDEAPWAESLIAFTLAVLEKLDKDGWDLSLLICDDAFIRDLNSRYRSKDEATDVLSFVLGEWTPDEGEGKRWAAGDIAISLDTLKKNAVYFGVSEDEEFRRLVIHGVLHLAGMDHEDNDADRPMLLLQEKVLAELADRKITIEETQA